MTFFKKWIEVDPIFLNDQDLNALSLFKQVAHLMEVMIFSFDDIFKPTLETLGSLVEQVLLVCCQVDLDLGEEYTEILLNMSNWILKKWNTEIPHYKNTKKVI